MNISKGYSTLCERVFYMEYIKIRGGKKLQGKLSLQGAKNSALPILAATLVCDGKCEIHNCPDITDVDAAINILKQLGCKVGKEHDIVTVNTDNANCSEISDDLMREMRSSIVFLGAIISRCGSAVLSFPGGCELGPRPIDIHLSSLRKMGVKIEESGGKLFCFTEERLKGCEIDLPIPSVGATENILLASVKAQGKTVIRNVAREPEIVDLANFLNTAGAKIYGAGESAIVVEGVDKLSAPIHKVIPDRIVAATYMSCCAVTGGEIQLENIIPEHLNSVIPVYADAGCIIKVNKDKLHIKSPKTLRPLKLVRTGYYPGFPTDAGPTAIAMSCFAKGTSIFVENIFENRYKCAGELSRMGAKIRIEGRVAVVEGRTNLSGTKVEAGDLRGGAALIAAGLGCNGETIVNGLNHIYRGYDDIVGNIKALNGDISLVSGVDNTSFNSVK